MQKNTKRKQQKKKKNKKRNRLQLGDNKVKTKAFYQLGRHNVLVFEILSRLPVKSRMRFKCVCKRCQSILQDDFYIDYQFSRSKATHTCSSFLHVDHVSTTKSACHELGDHEVSEILSRLLVKSLMGFKCVCKHWESIIQQEKFFIDLHLSRSKATHTCSLLHFGNEYDERKRLFTGEFFLPSEKLRTLETIASYGYSRHLMELNGRLCMLTYDPQEKTYKSIKMRTLYDHSENVQDKKIMITNNSSSSTTMSTSSAAGTSNNYLWVEETFSLPHYPWLRSIRHIVGTNLFIIGSPMNSTSHYHYIWNKKTRAITLVSIQNSSVLRGD